MKVIACYPRSMSAWLSNLLTVPNQSLYAHDILTFPDMVAVMQSLKYPNKGIVDTAASWDNLPPCDLTVIDNDLSVVQEKAERILGHDMSEAVEAMAERMESLKPHARVYHLNDMDEWIQEFYEHHTGLKMDWARYRVLRNLNIQSQLSHGVIHA